MAAINFDQPSKGQVSSTETALNVVNSGGGEGIRGTTNSDTNAAVVGMSQGRAHAGFFHSEGGVGGWFQSKTGEGLRGTTYSDDSNQHAVMGVSDGRASGGWFQSKTGEGLRGTNNSATYAAVVGVNTGGGIGVLANGKTAGRFEGDVEVTGDIRLLNADCAEDFDISESDNVEAGTVMVLNELGSLQPSYQEYDKKVAGIISGASGYKPAIILDRQESQDSSGRLPIALMGKAYCKVDARHSSIEIGDLLTTSTTKGYAMKADNPTKAFGTVIGKALGSIKEGLGIIPVLVALQ